MWHVLIMSGFHGFPLCICVLCDCVQRAMMRFSELELKEKEGGVVCMSASAAAAGRELADGQCRERALEHCQASTRQGERDGECPITTHTRSRTHTAHRQKEHTGYIVALNQKARLGL